MLKNNEKTTSNTEGVAAEDVAIAISTVPLDDAEGAIDITYEMTFPTGISMPFSSEFAVSADFFGHAMNMLSNVTAVQLAEIQTRIKADLTSNELALEEFENKASMGGNDVADTRKFGYTISNGVAVVPVTGLMTKRPSCMSWLMGEGASTLKIQQALRHADANPDVESKFLLIDSPGGEVAGSFDLANSVRNGKKPTDAHFEDLGASAAYLIASGARNISANENAVVGSIGVYTKMVDNTEAMAQMGYKVHLIKAGKHKAIGETGVPITPAHIAHVQSRIDKIHSLFLRDVAKGRNEMTKAQMGEVADAGVFIGRDAKKMGLVDQIYDTNGALRKAVQLNSQNIKSKGNDRIMTDETLRAMLSGTPVADATAEDKVEDATETPSVEDTTPVVATDPIYVAVKAAGVNTVEEFKSLVADALNGRTHLAEQRALAIKLAGVAFNATDPANDTLMATTTEYINSAPLSVVNASIGSYRQTMKLQGLTDDKIRQTVAAQPAFSALVEEEGSAKPSSAQTHVQQTRANHPVLGGAK